MKSVGTLGRDKIRRSNLLLLISEAGTINELAARTGVGRVYISHCKSGFRNIGDDVAHRFEYGMQKPYGWLDDSHLEDGHAELMVRVIARLQQLSRKELEGFSSILDISLGKRRSG